MAQQAVSIVTILQKLSDDEKKIHRLLHIIGYKSHDSSKALKSYLSLSTSISTVFLYHDLLTLSSTILKKALSADVSIFFSGSKQDKLWPGRVLLYCNLSFLMLKQGDLPSALKFLYDSESLLIDIKDDNECSDLTLASSIIGFIAMCRLGKINSAHEYLETATEEFNSIIRDGRKSKYNNESCSNLYCCFSFAGEIMNNPRAINDFEEFSIEIIEKLTCDSTAFRFLQRLVEGDSWINGLEVICSDDWVQYLFLVVFFPFIANNTPVVGLQEIMKEKEKNKRRNDLSGSFSPKKQQKQIDTYAFLMKNALQSFK